MDCSPDNIRSGRDRSAAFYAGLILAGLGLGALAGGWLGCYLYSHHMAFLHEGARPSCSGAPVVLWGGVASGAFIGAAASALVVMFIYHGGKCMRFFSATGAAFFLAAFSIYSMSQGKPIRNFIFTGIFIALGGFAVGTVVGLVMDRRRARETAASRERTD